MGLLKVNGGQKPPKTRDHDLVILGPYDLACGGCGQRVESPRETEVLTCVAQEVSYGQREVSPVQFTFAVCEACQGRRLYAEGIVEHVAGLRKRLGSQKVAIELVDACLIVLDVVGAKAATWDLVTGRAANLLDLIRALKPLGSAAEFSSLYAPVSHGGREGVAMKERWGHITDADELTMRAAYVSVLANRVKTPTMVPPPAGDGMDGCLFCGRGAVLARPGEEESVWGPMRSVPPRNVGGHPRPEEARGHLCPVCRSGADQHRGLGMSALESAFVAWSGIVIPLGERTIDGLRAWCALPLGTPPNREPWGHEGDREELKADLHRLATSA